MSTAFIGDFSNVAVWLGAPMGVRYAVSAAGGLMTATVLFVAGRELKVWTSAQANRAAAAFADVLLPAAIGTALIILVNQPIPLPDFAVARIGEGAFWIFAAAGAFKAPVPSTQDGGERRVLWQDLAIAVIMIAVVRVMVIGIPLSP